MTPEEESWRVIRVIGANLHSLDEGSIKALRVWFLTVKTEGIMTRCVCVFSARRC